MMTALFFGSKFSASKQMIDTDSTRTSGCPFVCSSLGKKSFFANHFKIFGSSQPLPLRQERGGLASFSCPAIGQHRSYCSPLGPTVWKRIFAFLGNCISRGNGGDCA